MRVGVIGVGHVGLVTAACMAEIGHEVVGADNDREKVRSLREGAVPFYEPGLQELVDAAVTSGRLRFTDEPGEAAVDADVVFICVGTPSRADGSPEMSYVQAAATTVAAHATRPTVVAEKSTVPVRTGERISRALALHAQSSSSALLHEVVSNPEFLREGTAVHDTLHPDRIVVGASSERAHRIMRELYAPQLARHECPYVATDVNTAELIKHASNAFLATKISFVNAVARICERAGADVHTLADAMGFDPRIGRPFLNAGLGYGGSCFPKDVSAFIHIAAELGYDFGLLRETERINREAKSWPLAQLRRLLWTLDGKEVAILGIAFKPETDDLRDAPAIDVIEALLHEGARVRLHDPVALPRLGDRFPEAQRCDSVDEALAGAHAVVVCTEWAEYAKVDAARLRELLTYPVVVDARAVWDPAELQAAGLVVASVGRPLTDG